MSAAELIDRPKDRRSQSKRAWRLRLVPTFVAVIAFAGMILLLYPTTAAWVSQYNQSKLIGDYSVRVSSDIHPTATEQLALAREYNSKLTAGAFLGANERVPTGDGTSADARLNYSDILRAGDIEMMARLKIPAIDVDLPIYHGTSDETLLKGVGHLEGTSLPVGGIDTHSVLTAHRGLASATMFNNLDQLEVGDTFTIEVFGDVLTYRVAETKVVQPHETEILYPQSGRDMVTLVTCTPLGVNTHRILVIADRVTPMPIGDVEAAGIDPDIPGFPWWVVWLGSGTVLIGAYVWLSGRPGRPGPNNSEQSPSTVDAE